MDCSVDYLFSFLLSLISFFLVYTLPPSIYLLYIVSTRDSVLSVDDYVVRSFTFFLRCTKVLSTLLISILEIFRAYICTYRTIEAPGPFGSLFFLITGVIVLFQLVPHAHLCDRLLLPLFFANEALLRALAAYRLGSYSGRSQAHQFSTLIFSFVLVLTHE